MNEADLARRVERAFVQIVEERADSKFKKAEFAIMLWPEMTANAAATRWAAIRTKASNTGKPQSVSIADAHRMAAVIGKDLNYLLVLAAERASTQK